MYPKKTLISKISPRIHTNVEDLFLNYDILFQVNLQFHG
jgi:hypothetical protein